MKVSHKLRKNWMNILVVFTVSGMNTAIATSSTCDNSLDGDRVISYNGITIKTCDHTAGAICSLSWNNKEFINDFDHGRQLQSATSFNYQGQPLGEAYNPTEAGSSHDGIITNPGQHDIISLPVQEDTKNISSSCLLGINTTDNQVYTKSKMAFFRKDWLYAGHLPPLSEHILEKKVTIGALWDKNLPNVIEYLTKFTVPTHQFHDNRLIRLEAGTFEVLTGYMPPEFNTFEYLDESDLIQSLNESDQPGRPLIFSSNADGGDWAMGIYSPKLPQLGFSTTGYQATNFTDQNVVKWNTVFRKSLPYTPMPVNASLIQNHPPFYFHSYVIVGTKDNVKKDMIKLRKVLNDDPQLLPANNW